MCCLNRRARIVFVNRCDRSKACMKGIKVNNLIIFFKSNEHSTLRLLWEVKIIKFIFLVQILGNF